MSRAPIDLRYTHKMPACTSVAAAVSRRSSRTSTHDLTARLQCLKALIDSERVTQDPWARRTH